MGVSTRRGGVNISIPPSVTAAVVRSGGGVEESAATPMEVELADSVGKRVQEGGLCGGVRRAARNPSRASMVTQSKRKAAEAQPGRGSEERKSKLCRRAGEGRAAPDATGVQSLPVRAHEPRGVVFFFFFPSSPTGQPILFSVLF